MFRTFVHSLSLWWQDFSEDILGADLPPRVYEEDLLEHHRRHAHRRKEWSPPRVGTGRRPGTVPSTELICLSPVPRPRERTRAPVHRH